MTIRLWLALLFFLAIAACEKTVPGKTRAETPVAQTQQKKTTRQENSKAAMDEADQIASLIDPAKLATLRERGANSRVQKITSILATAKQEGKNPEIITRAAVGKIGWGNSEKGQLTSSAILRNLEIAEKLGATTPADIAAMRRGNAATVRNGPYAGDILSVDHIIPRSIAPELDNVIGNLELMPLKINQRKRNKIGDRQRSLARQLHAAGLLKNPELPE